MNKHIEEYLDDYYIKLKSAPKYAVMLRGNWGSGKTWFINKFIKEQEIKEKKFFYVSLYGINSLEQIEDSFFSQAYPVLNSKGMRIAGKVFTGLLKTSMGNNFGDFSLNGKPESIIPDEKISSLIKNYKNRILVFDDLERCTMPISTILGYINQYVEQDDLKVIILANEEEIIKNNSSGDATLNYLTIKEKLIGRSFDVKAAPDDAIVYFIGELTDQKTKTLLQQKKDFLRRLFDTAGYNNLRHLRLTILDFERLYKLLPESALVKDQLIQDLIKIFFAVSFEVKKGEIMENEIRDVLKDTSSLIDSMRTSATMLTSDQKTIKLEPKKDKIKRIQTKYNLLSRYPPLRPELIEGFFKNGTTDKEQLRLSIESSSYYTDENTPSWKKLYHFEHLEDSDFDKLLEEVYNDFCNLQIKDLLTLIHITGIFIYFTQVKLINDKTKDDIITIAKQYNILHPIPNIANILRNKKRAYELSFMSIDDELFRDFIEFMITKSLESKTDDSYEYANELFELLKKNDLELFGTILFDEKSTTPILQYINEEEFVNLYISLRNSEKEFLCEILTDRYSQNNNKHANLIQEAPWLDKVTKLLISKKSDVNTRKVSSYHIENFINALKICSENLDLKPTSNEEDQA